MNGTGIMQLVVLSIANNLFNLSEHTTVIPTITTTLAECQYTDLCHEQVAEAGAWPLTWNTTTECACPDTQSCTWISLEQTSDEIYTMTSYCIDST